MIGKNTLINFLGLSSTLISQAIIFIWIFSFLDFDQVALVSISLTALTFSTTLLSLRTSEALNVFTAEYQNSKDHYSTLLVFMFLIKLILSTLLCSLIYIFSSEISSIVFSRISLTPFLQTIAFLIFIHSIRDFFFQVLKSRQEFALTTLSSIVENMLNIILLLIAVSIGSNSIIIFYIFAITSIASICILGFRLIHISQISIKAFFSNENRKSVINRDLIKFIFFSAATTTLSLVTKKFDELLVGILLNNVGVSLYSFAKKIVQVLGLGLAAVSEVVTPALSELKQLNEDKMIRVTKNVNYYIFFLALPIVGGLMYFVNEIFIFFPNYNAAGRVIQFMSVYLLLLSISTIASPILQIYKKNQYIFYIQFISSIVYLFSIWQLNQMFSFIGFALALLISTLVSLLLSKLYLDKLNVDYPLWEFLSIGLLYCLTAFLMIDQSFVLRVVIYLLSILALVLYLKMRHPDLWVNILQKKLPQS